MLWRAEDLYGIKLRGFDGTIGHIRDLLFDDTTWTIRYLVGEEVAWPFPHTFVIAPTSVKGIEWQERTCLVAVSRREVRDDPRLRLAESLISDASIALQDPRPWRPAIKHRASFQPTYATDLRGGALLRSARNLGTFTVQTADGRLGCVTDLLIHKKEWTICDLLIYVQAPGLYRRTMVTPRQIGRVDWGQSKIYFGQLPAADEATIPSNLAARVPPSRTPLLS
jgi:hypothetical protein